MSLHKRPCDPAEDDHKTEALRLEAVTTCVGFDDMLDVTLSQNFQQLDSAIVVTSHQDRRTQAVCAKHGVTCCPTDLFGKNGRAFNKGAAINAGMNYFQWHGWRMHIDSDVILPPHFRRMLFNHTHLEPACIYGADRVDVWQGKPIDAQHTCGMFVTPPGGRHIGARFVDHLNGYHPLGYFQLWHASCQKPYPYSLGTAAHDDLMFSGLWPAAYRRLLPSVIVYHLVTQEPQWGENWDGKRAQPRLT